MLLNCGSASVSREEPFKFLAPRPHPRPMKLGSGGGGTQASVFHKSSGKSHVQPRLKTPALILLGSEPAGNRSVLQSNPELMIHLVLNRWQGCMGRDLLTFWGDQTGSPVSSRITLPQCALNMCSFSICALTQKVGKQ